MLAYRDNRLLAALPLESTERLRPHLEPVALQPKHPLHRPNEPITHVYFPMTSVVSLLRRLPDGTAMEVATVGYEGLVGLALFLDTATTGREAITQVPGVALRLAAAHFTETVSQDNAVHTLLHRYIQALMTQIEQGVVCIASMPPKRAAVAGCC